MKLVALTSLTALAWLGAVILLPPPPADREAHPRSGAQGSQEDSLPPGSGHLAPYVVEVATPPPGAGTAPPLLLNFLPHVWLYSAHQEVILLLLDLLLPHSPRQAMVC